MRIPLRPSRRTSTAGVIAMLVAGLLPSVPPSAVLGQDDAPIPVSGPFEASGDAAGADVRYAWSVPEATGHWTIELTGPGDERLGVAIESAEGAELEATSGTGAVGIYDLELPAGDYLLSVARSGADALPFQLSTALEDPAWDPEPNDRGDQALPIADGDERSGRLARTDRDVDRYRLAVNDPDMLRDIHLEWEAELERELCLLDRDERPRQCRRGIGRVALLDLELAPGDHLLEVRGPEDPAAPYRLRLDPPRERTASEEAEPNDEFLAASAVRSELGVEGRSERADPDFHRVSIEGEPQLWRVELSGPRVDRLSWVRGDGDEVAVSAVGTEGQAARLDDLYLVPGSHTFRVRTTEGPYRLELTPLGPPGPDGEREPNDDDIRAAAYAVGQRRLGRLVTIEDQDLYRFTLAAPEHLRLRLRQPSDADIEVRLENRGTEILRHRMVETGAEIALDLWLRPGDHLLRLIPRSPSEGSYELTLERLDPFTLAADQEPNDVVAAARPAPLELGWSGDSGGEAQDIDAAWLPPLTAPGPATIRLEAEERATPRLFSDPVAGTRIDLEPREDGSFVAPEPPVGVPLYLEVTAGGPYAVSIGAPGWQPVEPPAAPTLALELDLETDRVAAHWPGEQRVAGRVSLDNQADAPIDLVLETRTSHEAWSASLERENVRVPAASSVEVPLTVRVRPDAWAGLPGRVSLAARALDGGLVTAAAEIEAQPDAAPAAPETGWDVPDALLGGLNVAGAALGGVPLGSVAADREPFLYDGVTPPGAGFGIAVAEYPLELVVDLAGEAPIPIAGTILNPLARHFLLREVPRSFELLLSTDGQRWEEVLAGELQPLPIDQAFVLEEPVPATHAMLRIITDHHDTSRSGQASLGEWKVIAAPGVRPDAMPSNIADPIRGGHVVRHRPFIDGLPSWDRMLDADAGRQWMDIDRDSDDAVEIVVGFQDGRAAQVTSLGWRDPDGTDEATRLERLEVELSTDGPLGPWASLGTWELERAPDGSVTPFDLDEPAWARYVRLSAPLPAEVSRVEAPAGIEVHERPPDDAYRSILGEWGYTSSQGPYEWLVPTSLDSIELGPDAGDSREGATPLPLATPRTDRAARLEDVDWYAIEVPATANTLILDVSGVPAVGVRLALFDADGDPVTATRTPRSGGIERYEAQVDPGQRYHLLVEQPPFNVAFTFDTSGSMGPFLDFVFEGVRAFAADVRPGREMAMIIPFERPPLLDVWQDQPLLLEDAVNGFVPGDESSNAESGLLDSMARLAEREGARAILIVTDAETGSLAKTPEVWRQLEALRPIVYSVHVGASNEPSRSRNLMRSWAAAAGGHYAFPTTHEEMDRAFERLSTRLRRPAVYGLEASASLVDRSPGSVRVQAPPGEPAALAPGVGVEIILDTSASMRERLAGDRRIGIAKASLRQLLRDGLAEGVPVALRTFASSGRSEAARCQTRLALPLAPLDRARALELVGRLRADRRTRTPIAAALAEVHADLAAVTGLRTVVLITDGNETCGGDPEAEIAALRAAGIEVDLNIVGFALEDEELKARMAAWADAAEGRYFDAAGADELAAAISTAVSVPFRVFPPGSDAAIARGTVGGDAVTLDPGPYRVEVLTEPVAAFEIEVLAGETLTLELPGRD